ncbi:MAG TPA: cation transporter [Gemmatimonadales bacterium]|nr:cation transporter [Gemmatimonadales bacterium]
MEQVTIHINGMSCGHCLNAVNTALAAVEGVTVGSVRIGRAEVSYDPSVTDPAQIVAAIEEAGYGALVAA